MGFFHACPAKMSATIRLLCSVLIAAACSGLVAADVSEAGRRPVDAKAAASDHLRKVQAEGSWTDDFEGAAETAAPKRARPARAPPAGAKPQEHYYFEAAFVLFLLCCGINIILGAFLLVPLALPRPLDPSLKGHCMRCLHNSSCMVPPCSIQSDVVQLAARRPLLLPARCQLIAQSADEQALNVPRGITEQRVGLCRAQAERETGKGLGSRVHHRG